MKPETAKLIRTICVWGAGAIAFAAIVLGGQLGSARYWLVGAATLLLVAGTFVAVKFYRCPHCGKMLPLNEKDLKNCPYCREKL